MSIETFERDFTCPDPASLSLTNIRGSVIIQAGQSGVISIVATKHTDSGDANGTHVELFQTDAGEVNAATTYDRSSFGFFIKKYPCKVDYQISVPTHCSLKIRGIANSVSIDGISGGMEIKSVSGDITLKNHDGEFYIKTVSGNVKGSEISGAADLKTVSGDVNLSQADFPIFRGRSISGDLKIESTLGEGPYDFNTVSGNIRLVVPELRGVTIRSSSFSGREYTPASASKLFRTRNSHQIMLGDGEVEISHKSFSGDFILENKNDTLRAKSRGEILENIAQGEISVDEALQQLIETNANKNRYNQSIP